MMPFSTALKGEHFLEFLTYTEEQPTWWHEWLFRLSLKVSSQKGETTKTELLVPVACSKVDLAWVPVLLSRPLPELGEVMRSIHNWSINCRGLRAI